MEMASPQRKYRVTKRFAIDSELVVWGRDENEAVLAADSAEISSWNEFDESWQLLEVSPISYLTLVEVSDEPDISTPVIKVWERTQAQGI
jgi:hypothetical protein